MALPFLPIPWPFAMPCSSHRVRGWWAGLGCAAKGGVVIAGQGCPGSEAIKVKVGPGDHRNRRLAGTMGAEHGISLWLTMVNCGLTVV